MKPGARVVLNAAIRWASGVSPDGRVVAVDGDWLTVRTFRLPLRPPCLGGTQRVTITVHRSFVEPVEPVECDGHTEAQP